MLYWNCIFHFSIVGQADEANFKSEEFGRDETAFDLEWVTESITEITKFKLQYKDDDYSSNDISDDKSTSWKEFQVVPQKNGEHFYTGKIMLKNLSKASRYVARVSSKNDYGYSKYSQPFRFGTKGAGESCLLTSLFLLNLFDEKDSENSPHITYNIFYTYVCTKY